MQMQINATISIPSMNGSIVHTKYAASTTTYIL